MKKKTIIIICIWIILFIVLFSVVKLAERNGNTLFETAGKVSGVVRKNKLGDLKAAVEGDELLDESEYTVSDEEKQMIADHIAEVKEIFKGHEYLLESSEELDLTIDLKKFKDGKEYRFEKLLWDISFEQVQNALPYSLLEDTSKTQTHDGYSYYISEYKHTLYRQTAVVSFEFYEDKLKMVKFTFAPEGKKRKVETFFEGIVDTLVDVCGHESVKVEDDTDGYVGYQWNGDNTVLQVNMVDSYVIISVGILEK